MTPESEAKKSITDGLRKLVLTLPCIPPSGNHYKQPRVICGHISWYLTKDAQDFKAQVAALAAGRTISPETDAERRKVAYSVRVTVILGKGDRRDADNSLKVALDSLKDCGVIHSDARVRVATGIVIWDRRNEGPRCEIVVEVCD